MPFTCPHNFLECNPDSQTCIHPVHCDYLVQQKGQNTTPKPSPSTQKQETKPTTSNARGFIAALISCIAVENNDKH